MKQCYIMLFWRVSRVILMLCQWIRLKLHQSLLWLLCPQTCCFTTYHHRMYVHAFVISDCLNRYFFFCFFMFTDQYAFIRIGPFCLHAYIYFHSVWKYPGDVRSSDCNITRRLVTILFISLGLSVFCSVGPHSLI